MPFSAKWMQLEILILGEISQKEKDKYHMISFIPGISCMAQMNLSIKKKLTNLENRLVVAEGEGEEEGWTGNLGLIDTNSCLWNG